MRKNFDNRLKQISERHTLESRTTGIDPDSAEDRGMLETMLEAAEQGGQEARDLLEAHDRIWPILAPLLPEDFEILTSREHFHSVINCSCRNMSKEDCGAIRRVTSVELAG